jgi:succinate dehydrogenase/fumarate reductase flavoprotein subunit
MVAVAELSTPRPRPMPGSSVRSNVANVLVIGTGAAGLRAAIAAHQAGSEVTAVRTAVPAGRARP